MYMMYTLVAHRASLAEPWFIFWQTCQAKIISMASPDEPGMPPKCVSCDWLIKNMGTVLAEHYQPEGCRPEPNTHIRKDRLREGNPSIDLLMVIMASGIVWGRVHTTATELPKMSAIPQLKG